MITHDELIYLIAHHYPTLAHGRDFLAAHPIDEQTGEQQADAKIVQWRADVAQPDEAELIESFGALKDAFLAKQARAKRNGKLAQSDWTQLTDIPPATQQRWRPYRQALRDLPQQKGFPQSIQWPKPPTVQPQPAPKPKPKPKPEPKPAPEPKPDPKPLPPPGKPRRPGRPPPPFDPPGVT